MTSHPPATGVTNAAASPPLPMPATRPDSPLEALIIGAGFGGIGMGRALLQAGIDAFVILERAQDVGGVWRDNAYPGAACDVPSHLYSFSFAPNPDFPRTFATQPDILAYLRTCTRAFGLLPHLHLGQEVAQVEFDEAHAVWEVRTAAGTTLHARLLVTATGLLSRPALPRIAGMDSFAGPSFHSARWDHTAPLAGKRVAVIGTGASATQFIPAIAGQVAQLLVFQRSASWLKPRGDRAYPAWRKTLFRRMPLAMRLHRAMVYAKYEARGLAFTGFRGLMELAVGRPFRRMLARDLDDASLRASLRARLTPDYPIGCKRILLSDDYLASFADPRVRLETEAIARIRPEGIETADGVLHATDVIIYGTGFAATDFLAPMTIRGRGGLDLNAAWRDGARAYLGTSVPGFPNFFMLYGPNTNLGHNSIVYMLESQVAHVMRCLRALRATGSSTVEAEPGAYRAFNARLAKRLGVSVWNGCRSWYLDRHGRNSANWPGFSFTYRWLARHASLSAYRFAAPLPDLPGGVRIAAPPALAERLQAGFQRAFLRACFRSLIGPPFSARFQRRAVALLAPLMPGVGGVRLRQARVQGVPIEILTPDEMQGGIILYLHGGAFCLGGPRTHRSITTRLARDAGMTLWAPDYRLAPEHPYPAAIDDAATCYQAILASGIQASEIVLAGDSAGGALALALALRLRDSGQPLPAGLALVSPVADPGMRGESVRARAGIDPMVRAAWLAQGLRWYACPRETGVHAPLTSSLHGLPPMLVQVGEQEILHDDAVRLAAHAKACGVSCTFEEYAQRWHVFHLQAFYLRSAAHAIVRLAAFARSCVANEELGRVEATQAVTPEDAAP